MPTVAGYELVEEILPGSPDTTFGRKEIAPGDMDWVPVTEEAPDDGQQYARKDRIWQAVVGGGAAIFTDLLPPANPAPDTLWMDSGSDGVHAGRLYVWFADGPRGAAWVQVGGPMTI